jgi:hypothetical protein
VQPCLLHSGCKITTHFFLLRIWTFRHCSIIQIQYNSAGVKKSWGLPHHYLRPIPLDSSFHPDRCDTYHFLHIFFLVVPTSFLTPYLGPLPLASSFCPNCSGTYHFLASFSVDPLSPASHPHLPPIPPESLSCAACGGITLHKLSQWPLPPTLRPSKSWTLGSMT